MHGDGIDARGTERASRRNLQNPNQTKLKRLTYHATDYDGTRPLFFLIARHRKLSVWRAILNLLSNL